MRASGALEDLRCLEAPLADAADIKRVHQSDYVDLIFENAPTEGYLQLEPDTAMNPYALSAARRAAGAGVLAVDEVMAGRLLDNPTPEITYAELVALDKLRREHALSVLIAGVLINADGKPLGIAPDPALLTDQAGIAGPDAIFGPAACEKRLAAIAP